MENKKYFVGIDLGGTFVKGGIVDEKGNIILTEKTDTKSELGADGVAQNIALLTESLLEKTGINRSSVVGLGLGCPGVLNVKKGEVLLAYNLKWKNINIVEKVSCLTGFKVKIGNDADMATVGEAKFGIGENCENIAMITLGTGIGSGVISDGKLVSGIEFGHIVIVDKGEPCSCGRKGCFEAYASGSALIRETRKMMAAHLESKMWQDGTLQNVDGKTAFKYYKEDAFAKIVVDEFIEKLACGITNIVNAFSADMIIIGGGISNEGDNLLIPLRKIVNAEKFGGNEGDEIKIVKAKLGNSAGLLGAASLFMN